MCPDQSDRSDDAPPVVSLLRLARSSFKRSSIDGLPSKVTTAVAPKTVATIGRKSVNPPVASTAIKAAVTGTRIAAARKAAMPATASEVDVIPNSGSAMVDGGPDGTSGGRPQEQDGREQATRGSGCQGDGCQKETRHKDYHERAWRI